MSDTVSTKTYDIIVIGGGPAGVTAAVYGARAGKDVLLIEKEAIGGKITTTPRVENIPGFSSISGIEFGENLLAQAETAGVTIEYDNVLEIIPHTPRSVVVRCEYSADNYHGKTCIIATGTVNRRLNLPNEENFIGNGISFCSTCDGAFYKDKTVIVVGGGNSALTEALELSEIASNVILVQNLDFLTAEKALISQIESKDNISIKLGMSIDSYLIENNHIAGLRTDKEVIRADGIFLAVGLIPNNEPFQKEVYLDSNGFIKEEQRFLNIFACGDCTEEKVKQVAVACGDGAKTALKAVQYIKNIESV